jgi:hypothetical protein
MRIKYKPIILAVALIALLSFVSKAGAVSSNNPFQATISVVEQMIANALAPLNNLLNNHEQRILELENNVEALETRIEQLEATPTPTITPTPIVTPTPDLRPFEATINRDGNQFTVTSNKIITDCRYRSSSPSGGITITTNSGNLADGTSTCVMTLSNTGWSYTITVKDETGEAKSFSGTV